MDTYNTSQLTESQDQSLHENKENDDKNKSLQDKHNLCESKDNESEISNEHDLETRSMNLLKDLEELDWFNYFIFETIIFELKINCLL